MLISQNQNYLPNSKMLEEFKNSSSYQSFQNNQIAKLLAAQQRKYNPAHLPEVYKQKPSSLYQEYLNKTGLIQNKPQHSFEDSFKKDEYNRSKLEQQHSHQGVHFQTKPEFFEYEQLEQSQQTTNKQEYLSSNQYDKTSTNSNRDDIMMNKQIINNMYNKSNMMKSQLSQIKPEEDDQRNLRVNVLGIIEPDYQKQNFHKQNQLQKQRIYPNIHYTEYKDNTPQAITNQYSKKLTQTQNMENRTKTMISSLRNKEQSFPQTEQYQNNLSDKIIFKNLNKHKLIDYYTRKVYSEIQIQSIRDTIYKEKTVIIKRNMEISK